MLFAKYLFTFQHDNDPKRTTKTTTQWLKEKKVNILKKMHKKNTFGTKAPEMWVDIIE